MTSLTLADLDELQKLEREATPGPWEVYRYDNSGGEINWQVCAPGAVIRDCSDLDEPKAHKTSEFIAALRNAAPALIALAKERLRMGGDWGKFCVGHAERIAALEAENAELKEKREHGAKANHQAWDEIRALQASNAALKALVEDGAWLVRWLGTVAMHVPPENPASHDLARLTSKGTEWLTRARAALGKATEEGGKK